MNTTATLNNDIRKVYVAVQASALIGTLVLTVLTAVELLA